MDGIDSGEFPFLMGEIQIICLIVGEDIADNFCFREILGHVNKYVSLTILHNLMYIFFFI